MVADLPRPGLPKHEDVGVGDRDVVVEDPAEGVGVERAAGEHVDAHLRAGRRQPGGGDERPQHRRLVRGHPPRRRPAPTPAPTRRRAGAARGVTRAGTAAAPRGVLHRCGTEGRSWPKSASSRATVRPASWRRGVRWCVCSSVSPPSRVRLTPSGTVGGGERDVLGQVQAQRGEPGPADGGVEPPPELGDPAVLGTVTVHTA